MKHLIWRTKTLILLIALIPQPTFSQQKEALSLSLFEAQEYAIQNNLQRKNAALDVEIAKKKVWETTAIGLPQVNFSTNYQHQFEIPQASLGYFLNPNLLPAGVPLTKDDILNAYQPSDPITFGVKNNTTFNVTATQLVFSGAYIVGLQASKAYKDLSELALSKTDQDIKSNVASAYYTILLLKEINLTLDSSLTNLKQTLTDTEAMRNAGFVDDVVVDQVRVSLFMIENSANETKRQYNSSKNLLKFLLGVALDSDIELTEGLSDMVNKLDPDFKAAHQFDPANNLDLQLMANQIQLSNLQLKLEKSNYLPNISMFYTYQKLANEPVFNFTPTSLLGASLNIPIFTSGMRNAKVQQARLALDKSQNSYNQVLQSVEMDLTDAVAQLAVAWEKHQSQKETKDLANRVYQNYRIRFAKGMSSQQDLIQANDKYLQAVGNYASAVVELFNARLRVDKILGNLK
jgi:outer membrane protein